MAQQLYRVHISKDGKEFWRSKPVPRNRAFEIEKKNLKLIKREKWNHIIEIKEDQS